MYAGFCAILCLLLWDVGVAAPLIVRSNSMEMHLTRGVVTTLRHRELGETLRVASAPPLSGLRHLREGELWNTRARVESRATRGGAQVTFRWRTSQGSHSLQTRFVPQPDGSVIVVQQAQCSRPGLIGLQWGIALPHEVELLIPAHSGLRFSADSDYEPRRFDYPFTWEAQFVLIQGRQGGFLIHAEDNARHFKRLFLEHRDGQFWLGFETWCQAPFEKVERASSTRWRIRPYRGSWLNGAAMYRQWAERTFGLRALRQTQPSWVHEIQTVVFTSLNDTELLQALANHLNPRQTLLYVTEWRKDGYDRNYPDYTPIDGFAQQVAQAKRLGFRVMLHVNYFGCTPENPAYESLKQYHMRDPFTGHRLHWEWNRADPPIKFAYINPAAKAWRRLFVQRMVELCRQLQPDALHLDQTLCIYNDANGTIDGMNCMEGNIALHRELREALPQVALSGEGLNEISFRYESFAQRHVWGINHADTVWDMELVHMTHPVSSSLFAHHTRAYGYLGMTNPHMWEYYIAWRTAYERIGALPTLAFPWKSQLVAPNVVMRTLLREMQWFQRNAPQPDFLPSRWDGHTLFAYRTADGSFARYRREATGVCLESWSGGKRAIVIRRVEGVVRARIGGSIPRWQAYRGDEILGLNPQNCYLWLPEPPPDQQVHLSYLPAHLMLVEATSADGQWAHFAVEPQEEEVARLWRQRSGVRSGVSTSSLHLRREEAGYMVEDVETGAVARPQGKGLFMHPPWRKGAGGTVWLEFDLNLPANRQYEFRSQIRLTSPEAAQRSTGIIFGAKAKASEASVYHKMTFSGKQPRDFKMDLSGMSGRRVRLRLEVHPGVDNSPDYDWGYWVQPRVVALRRGQSEVEVFLQQPLVHAFFNGDRITWSEPAPRRYQFTLPTSAGTLTLLLREPELLSPPADLTGVAFETGLEVGGLAYEPVDYLRGAVQAGVCRGQRKEGFFAHPPTQGRTFLAFLFKMPPQGATLKGFSGIADGAEGKTTGVRFYVEVNGAVLWSRDLQGGEGWIPFEVSLHRWAGEPILLRLVTDSLGDFGWDWAYWGEVRLEEGGVQ